MLALPGSTQRSIVVVGAGVGGLVAALLLAHRGFAVTVLEKEPVSGGKLRVVDVDGRPVDSGPTVLTMRSVFDEILSSVGEVLDDRLTLDRAGVLARHHWPDGTSLDLFADVDRSAEAIAAFAGRGEAEAYRGFCARAAAVHATLEASFIRSQRPSPVGLARSAGLRRLPALLRIRAFSSLWRVVCDHFRDPRLRQLYGRYATYCGASPFEAAGPLVVVAHVEQSGVWTVRQGMHALAAMLEQFARERGVRFLHGCQVERIEIGGGRVTGVVAADGTQVPCAAIVFNGDPAALAGGMLGEAARPAARPVGRGDRSLSAITLSMVARAEGLRLAHHNVFFSGDCEAEFAAIRRHRTPPTDPTVYLCAQDRTADGGIPAAGPERLFTIVNAPADGDRGAPDAREIEECRTKTLARLEACGLAVRPQALVTTSPVDFDRLFPGTGGALYGMASHGWRASFRRPAARTPVAGLYLAGGAVHPGPGLPMAALSGRNAALAIIRDLDSTTRWRPAAMPGGTSTP